MLQKFPENFWISEVRTIQPKILEILGAKMNRKKTPAKKNFEIWVYIARLSSFLEISENAVLFVTGSCRKFKADIWLNGKSPKSLYALAYAAWRLWSSAQTSQGWDIETARRLASPLVRALFARAFAASPLSSARNKTAMARRLCTHRKSEKVLSFRARIQAPPERL